MNNCQHQFVIIASDLEQTGVEVVCLYCGQIRYVMGDGTIHIKLESGKIIRDSDDK